MSKEIEEAVTQLLTEAGLEGVASLQGPRVRENNWECDAWLITIRSTRGQGHVKSTSFDYYTGTGHRKVPKHVRRPYYIKDARGISQWTLQEAKPVAPHIAGPLYSVIRDGYALTTSFLYWCEELGYSTDSISAMNTYNACCNEARQMQQFLGMDLYRKLEEVLQDY